MARPLRFQYPGAIYHLMARGDGGKTRQRRKADGLEKDHGEADAERLIGLLGTMLGLPVAAGMRVELRSNGPRAEHKEGRSSDSPRPWRVNGKRFAITHWLFRGQRRSGVRRSMNLPFT
jgi:hypothetical protein